MLILCSKKKSLIFATRRRFISAKTSTKLALMGLNCNKYKLRHAQICLYYDQITWLPSSRAIKSFRVLRSHTMSIGCKYEYHRQKHRNSARG